MMWDRIKNSKGFYITLSILFGIICWFYVDLTVEPDIYVNVRNIPVTYEGLDELGSKGLMIKDSENITVTLKLSGQRSTISQLNRSNIIVKVDAAAQITGPGEQSLEYTVSFPSTVLPSNVKIRSRSAATIDVSVVKASSKSVPISGEFTGSVADGYKAEGFELEYRLINVSGEKSVIEAVDHAVVTLDQVDLTDDWKGTLPITLVDQNGKMVKTDQLNLSHNEMSVTMVVRRVKELPLSITIKDGGGATADDVSYEISPKIIKISGTKQALDSLDEWNVGTIDLSQVITSEKQTFKLSLPDGVNCESGEKEVSVKVKLPKLSTIKMETSNIQLKNVPSNKTATLQTKQIEVRIRGAKKTLDLLVSSDIEVEADFSELKDDVQGICTIPAKVVLHGFTEIGAVGTYEVSVYVS